MSQLLYIKSKPEIVRYNIDDEELCIYEFQRLFEEIKIKLNIKIDGYSSGLIKFSKNRYLGQFLTQEMYLIEESFPESKKSKFNTNKLISRNIIIRFFSDFLNILDMAYRENSDIIIVGEKLNFKYEISANFIKI